MTLLQAFHKAPPLYPGGSTSSGLCGILIPHMHEDLPTQASLSPLYDCSSILVVPLSTRPDADFVCYRGC